MVKKFLTGVSWISLFAVNAENAGQFSERCSAVNLSLAFAMGESVRFAPGVEPKQVSRVATKASGGASPAPDSRGLTVFRHAAGHIR